MPSGNLPVLAVAALLAGIPCGLFGRDPFPGSDPLERRMDRAWELVWQRFFIPEVETFADYLSSYEPGKELAHLPTAAEVKRQFPNPCGYGSGMEDGMILGGAMLSLLADRYAVTGDPALKEEMAKVFRGVRRCLTVHGVPGFVARNVCREDGTSIYLNSSRDQVTHCIHGLWKYYHCRLADEATRGEIRTLLAAVADRMIDRVTPENGYDFGRADGKPCPLGICRMWEVQSHEAARLPMVYAAAWEATGEPRFEKQWRRFAAEAVEQSAQPGAKKPAYALLQMQCSLEVLHALEPEAALREKIAGIMRQLGGMGEKRNESVVARLRAKTPDELAMLGPDWRTVSEWKDQGGYPNPQWGPYREIWHLTREAGESALLSLMPEDPGLSPEGAKRLGELLGAFDYERNSSCGLVYHLAAYWKARFRGRL